MKRLGVVLAALAASAVGAVAASGAARDDVAPQGYIVVYRNVGDASAKTDSLERRARFVARYRYGRAIKGFAADLSNGQLAQVEADPGVAFVSDDVPVSAESANPIQPLAAGEAVPTGILRIGAATRSRVHRASKAPAAVIDTGVELADPDLNVVSGKNCVQAGTPADDDNGHGTHVAGTIAASNTGSGVVGVAPNTRIYAVKVLNARGSGTLAQVICGVDWVAAHGPGTSRNIQVANMSLSAGGSNDGNCGKTNGDALHMAICNAVSAGVTFVVAAGNSGTDYSGWVPAAYPEVLTVTATSDSDGKPGAAGGAPSCRPSESDDTFASFSNYADPSNDAQVAHTIAAPGVCFQSDWLGAGFNTISGTSMATPHVTGTVALCIDDAGTPGPCSGKTPAEIVAELRASAQAHATAANGFLGDPLQPVPGKYFGFEVDAKSY